MSANKIRRARKFISKRKLSRINALEMVLSNLTGFSDTLLAFHKKYPGISHRKVASMHLLLRDISGTPCI